MAESWGCTPLAVLDLPVWCVEHWRSLRNARRKFLLERVADAFSPGEPSKEWKDAKAVQDTWVAACRTCEDWMVDELLEKIGNAQAKMDEHAPRADADSVQVRLLHSFLEQRVT